MCMPTNGPGEQMDERCKACSGLGRGSDPVRPPRRPARISPSAPRAADCPAEEARKD